MTPGPPEPPHSDSGATGAPNQVESLLPRENKAPRQSEESAKQRLSAALQSEEVTKRQLEAARQSEESAKQRLSAALQSEEATKRQLEAARQSEESAKQRLSAAQQSEEAAKRQLEAARQSEESAKQRLSAALQSEEAAKRHLEAARQSEETAKLAERAVKSELTDRLPGWSLAGGVTPACTDLVAWAEKGNIGARRVLAYLRLMAAVCPAPSESEYSTLRIILLSLGRSLSAAQEYEKLPPQEASRGMTAWSVALNGWAEGAISVGVPQFGARFEPQKMQSEGAHLESVAGVRNWWLRNSKSIIDTKAEVY